MEFIKLTNICNPKQWKTISTTEFIENGKYNVYGANGIIGKTNYFNHEIPTLLLTCRGATCGSLHITQEKCYVNGNAMCLDNLSEKYNINFIYYYLKNYDMNKVISGTAQPQITISSLGKVLIPVIPIKLQLEIVKELEKIEKLIKMQSKLLENLNEIVKSQFIEMFGTINMNQISNNWESIDKYCKIYTGTTPSSSDESNWNGDIPWVTPSEINTDSFYIYSTIRKITEKGRKSKSLDIMPVNTVLLSTRAPIGKVAIAGVPMTCNQGFKNFVCCEKLNHIFLYVLLKNNKSYLNSLGSGTTFLEISRSKISKIKIPIPPIELQNKFASFVEQIDKSKYFGGVSYA